MYRMPKNVRRFDFAPGRKIDGKYEIERPLGSGWEGEVYAIIERTTGIRRAAKFYYPYRDPTGKAAIAYARKLDALRLWLNLIEVFHVIVGGRERYARQPQIVKEIIRGLKDSLILQRFQSAGDIQRHLENLQW